MDKYLQVKNLSKTYIGGYCGINQVNFELDKGETLAIVGGNGSGKTTILSLIAGLETESSGEIVLDGKMLCGTSIKNRGIGYINKELQLNAHKTARENIGYPLKLRKVDKKLADDIILNSAKLFEIENLLDKKVKNLTYFEKLKVCLARLISVERKLYLIDNLFDSLEKSEFESVAKMIKKAFDKKTLIVAFERAKIAETFCADKFVYLGYGISLGIADIKNKSIFKSTLEGAKLLYDRRVCCIPCSLEDGKIRVLNNVYEHNYKLKSQVFDEVTLLLKMDAIHFDNSGDCSICAQIDFVNKDNIGYFDIDYKIATISLERLTICAGDKLDFSFNINDGILYDFESEKRISI